MSDFRKRNSLHALGKMNFDQMKEHLLKYRDWLKVDHDLSANEEIADFFSSKAFTEEWIEEISIVE